MSFPRVMARRGGKFEFVAVIAVVIPGRDRVCLVVRDKNWSGVFYVTVTCIAGGRQGIYFIGV